MAWLGLVAGDESIGLNPPPPFSPPRPLAYVFPSSFPPFPSGSRSLPLSFALRHRPPRRFGGPCPFLPSSLFVPRHRRRSSSFVVRRRRRRSTVVDSYVVGMMPASRYLVRDPLRDLRSWPGKATWDEDGGRGVPALTVSPLIWRARRKRRTCSLDCTSTDRGCRSRISPPGGHPIYPSGHDRGSWAWLTSARTRAPAGPLRRHREATLP